MSKARNLADLLDANGDVVSGALDNVPPSNDASALTTGTLPIARIADGDITAAKLGSTLDLSGKTVTLPAGTGGKVVNLSSGYTGNEVYGSFSLSGSVFQDTGKTFSVTKTQSSSTLVGSLILSMGSDMVFTRWGAQNNIRIDGSSTSVVMSPSPNNSLYMWNSRSNMDRDNYIYYPVFIKDSAATTGTRTYRWWLDPYGMTIRGGGIRWIVWEVMP